jgi:hypothetical protein
MKKNLRNLLVLSLGLITTIASAQWGATSTSWIDNTDSDARTMDNRTTLTVDLSSIHVSADYNSAWNNAGTSQSNANVYEAYASTDVMGFGTLTMGRQDLSFGSGALVSSDGVGHGGSTDTNDVRSWKRYTTDGADFAASFGGIAINAGTMSGISTATNYVNAGGSFSGVSFNMLMVSTAGVKSHGYDLGYSLMDGALNLHYSTNDDGGGNEMTDMGGSYNVMDNVSIHGSMRQYEGTAGNTFTAANSAWNEGLKGGSLDHKTNGSEIMSYGLNYSLGDVTLGYTMHTLSMAGAADTDMTDMTLSYNLNDNCTLGYRSYKNGAVEVNLITVGIGL